jgi:AAA domain
MTTAFERILDKLEGVKRNGNKATARCPAHDDHNPSLSIRRLPQRVKLLCFAGCDDEAVLAALNLHVRDLFDDRKGARYHYEDGWTAHRSWEKKFWQTSPTNKTNGKHPQPTQLYELSKVNQAVADHKPIYLVEGEQDADAINSLDEEGRGGGVATTARMGADNFHLCDSEPLRGAQVIAIVDRDEPGEQWARKVLAKLEPTADSLDFMHPREGKDATDHLMHGHSLEQLVPRRPPEPNQDDPAPAESDQPQPEIDARYLQLVSKLLDSDGLATLTPPQPLVEGWLYKDSLAWIQGKWGNGKSFTVLDIGCCVATGTPWQGHAVQQGTVLYLIAEGASGLRQRKDAWEIANERKATGIIYLPMPVQLATLGR